MTVLWSADGGDRRSLARAYLLAKRQVIASGFEEEIAWQETISLHTVTPTTFVREAAWVVLCAGMREVVVRGRFEVLGSAFESWNPHRIGANSGCCRRRALQVFNHVSKIDAIVEIACEVARNGLEPTLQGVGVHGPVFLTRFPYIGNITCFHLAKNLGVATAKPDRHLERMADALGFGGAQEFCETIAEVLSEPVQVVDLVMWRFATIERAYIPWLTSAVGSPEYAC